MKITLNDKLTIIIQWFHSNPLKENKKNSIFLPFGTKCNILRYEKDKKTDKLDILAIGQSFLHNKDRSSFNKDKGRKLSLMRATKNSMFSKEDKKLIWDTYLKTIKKYKNVIL